MSGYERLADMFDFASKDVEERSGVLASLLFGTNPQCSHMSLYILLQFHLLECPYVSYFSDLEMFVSCTKDSSTSYQYTLHFQVPKSSLSHRYLSSSSVLQGKLGRNTKFHCCSWDFWSSIPSSNANIFFVNVKICSSFDVEMFLAAARMQDVSWRNIFLSQQLLNHT